MEILTAIWNAGLVALGHGIFWLGALACVIAIPVGLPGTWALIGMALVFALFTGFIQITWGVLFVLVVAAAIGEIVEFLGGMVGARYGGASKYGMIAATLGGLGGAVMGTVFIPVPVVGSVIGAFAMCFLSVLAVEYYRLREYEGAMRAGFWAFVGRVFSIFAKTGIGAGMVVGLLYRIYLAG